MNLDDGYNYNMALNLVELNASARRFMLEEIRQDIAEGRLYMSPRLSPAGRSQYPDLLQIAASTGTDDTLASALRVPGLLNTTEERKKSKGGTTIAQVPSLLQRRWPRVSSTAFMHADCAAVR